MFSLHLDMKGAQQAKKQLRQIANKQLSAVLRKALRNGAKLVQKEAKSTIEVRTGATRRTLKVRTGKSNRKKDYIRFKMITQNKDEDAFYYSFVELGTKYIKARNTIRKAGERMDKRVRKEVAEYVKTHI